MKLGIAVVYLVSERNGPLLDLHLRHLEKNTESPYTIYACVNGLLPRFRATLEKNPRVRICPCETYPGGSALWRSVPARGVPGESVALQSKYEHSWYLEQLIQTAVDDGVSHVVLFHVDSFPVLRGWDNELIGRLSDRCVLAGITRDSRRDHKPLTACLLFTRDFYLRYQPRLLLSRDEMDTQAYRRYSEACPHVRDSGFGYGFKMFAEGLSWYPLVKSNRGGIHALFASIYGDLIFHLHAAVFIERTQTVGFTLRPSERPGLIGRAARLACILVPLSVRDRIRRHVLPQIETHCEPIDRQSWERERRWLFDDSEGYLMYLRTGVRA